MKELVFKEGEVLFRPLFSDHIKIAKIETHEIKGKLKTKLANPIYHMEYLLNYQKPFTTYLKEIQQMVSFGRWVKI